MNFVDTKIPGVFLVLPKFVNDERGFFTRVFCQKEFRSKKINFKIKQINNSLSIKPKTLRGLHYQIAPFGEEKYLRCINGSVLDIVVDLREGSPTFGEVVVERLTSLERNSIFVPKGCAHGFLTLEPNTEVIYLVSEVYSKDHERIIRWNDPIIKEKLTIKPEVISFKDSSSPDYQNSTHASGYSFQVINL